MRVIPAIDIRGGKVVRLAQGLAGKETIYSDSPLEVAQKWASFGVEMIHVVDLDGAMAGKLKNLGVVEKIARKIRPRVELGGGIRDEQTVERVLNAGVAKVVIGTKALDEKFLAMVAGRFGGRVVAGLDARNGIVYTKGWLFATKTKAARMVKLIERSGVKTINYTDISRDGMLEGPNIEEIRGLLKTANIDVVASGGISDMEDVKKMKALEKDGLTGIIIGKALYEGRIDLREAMRICYG